MGYVSVKVLFLLTQEKEAKSAWHTAWGIYLYRLEFLPIPQMPVEKVDKPSVLSIPSSSLYILLLQMLSSFQKADTQPSFKPNVLTTMTFIVG